MKENMKEKMLIFFGWLMVILFIAFIAFIIWLEIYLWITYGNLPPDEVPSWVHWLMWRR